MSDQIKQDLERIKNSTDKMAKHAATRMHDVFATSLNLLAENFERLEKAIDKDRSKQECSK